ncbi:hypothetical protein GGR56DRAFT_508178 [Xylariaceae sp. FL0804]|nr:hypothetical protein GGR56DRAFT_508178 [Xylariaceae sp. FL0804]
MILSAKGAPQSRQSSFHISLLSGCMLWQSTDTTHQANRGSCHEVSERLHGCAGAVPRMAITTATARCPTPVHMTTFFRHHTPKQRLPFDARYATSLRLPKKSTGTRYDIWSLPDLRTYDLPTRHGGRTYRVWNGARYHTDCGAAIPHSRVSRSSMMRPPRAERHPPRRLAIWPQHTGTLRSRARSSTPQRAPRMLPTKSPTVRWGRSHGYIHC